MCLDQHSCKSVFSPTAGPCVLTNIPANQFPYQLQADVFWPTFPQISFLTSCRPMCFGANLTSVTEVRLSTRLVRFNQWFWPASFSHTAAVRSNEQVANTWPNSGCAHVTRHTDPLCVWQDKANKIFVKFSHSCDSCHLSSAISTAKTAYFLSLLKDSVTVRVTWNLLPSSFTLTWRSWWRWWWLKTCRVPKPPWKSHARGAYWGSLFARW